MTIQKLLFHPLSLTIFTLSSLALAVSLLQTTHQTQRATTQLQSLKDEVNASKTEIADLEYELNKIETTDAKEKMIRDELLMKKPGEYVIQIADLDLEEDVVAAEAEKKSPWREWRQILFP